MGARKLRFPGLKCCQPFREELEIRADPVCDNAASRICFLLDKYVWKRLSTGGMRQLLLSTIFELDSSIIAFLNILKSVAWDLAKAVGAFVWP